MASAKQFCEYRSMKYYFQSQIAYPSGVSVNLGNELTPTSVKNVPKVEWIADLNELYTLVMVDPDALSRTNPMFRSIRHWAVINIPGSDVTKGDQITEYVGAGPPNGAGLHRYVFLVYKQNGGRIEYDGPIVSNRYFLSFLIEAWKLNIRNSVNKIYLHLPGVFKIV